MSSSGVELALEQSKRSRHILETREGSPLAGGVLQPGGPRMIVEVPLEGFGKDHCMTRTPSLSHPFLLGFDDIERALDRVTKGASEGYPPYNIERMPRIDDEPIARTFPCLTRSLRAERVSSTSVSGSGR